MNPDNSADPSDSALDDLLASMTVEVSPEFTTQTLARIHSEQGDEEAERTLDACFARQPITSSPEFLRKTLSRIHYEAVGGNAILSFPRLVSWVSAAAAIVLIGIFGFQFRVLFHQVHQQIAEQLNMVGFVSESIAEHLANAGKFVLAIEREDHTEEPVELRPLHALAEDEDILRQFLLVRCFPQVEIAPQ